MLPSQLRTSFRAFTRPVQISVSDVSADSASFACFAFCSALKRMWPDCQLFADAEWAKYGHSTIDRPRFASLYPSCSTELIQLYLHYFAFRKLHRRHLRTFADEVPPVRVVARITDFTELPCNCAHREFTNKVCPR